MINNKIEKIVRGMEDYLKESNSKGFILGVSGGIDSSLMALILKKYFDGRYITYWINIDSSDIDLKYISLLVKEKNILNEMIDLSFEFNSLKKTLNLNKESEGNVKSRLRMMTLYAKAQENKYLVIGTTNYIEFKIGYFTKYGDGASDISPLREFLKYEIKELSIIFDVPKDIINREPSAGLYEGQTDEADIGITYDELDSFFENKNVSKEIKDKINKKINDSKHKREISPSLFLKNKGI